MNADLFLETIIRPGCDELSNVMGLQMGSPEALVLLLAIALQESALTHRRQVGGPARGFWQFESGGGVKGVMTHPASASSAQTVCAQTHVPWVQADVYEALAWHDQLAVAFGRLLLWTDAYPLPDLGEQQAAWDTYIKNWRPGKPHPETWSNNYQIALETVTGNATQIA